jgi:hypothetical protein
MTSNTSKMGLHHITTTLFAESAFAPMLDRMHDLRRPGVASVAAKMA